jgi:hypothetical protein
MHQTRYQTRSLAAIRFRSEYLLLFLSCLLSLSLPLEVSYSSRADDGTSPLILMIDPATDVTADPLSTTHDEESLSLTLMLPLLLFSSCLGSTREED